MTLPCWAGFFTIPAWTYNGLLGPEVKSVACQIPSLCLSPGYNLHRWMYWELQRDIETEHYTNWNMGIPAYISSGLQGISNTRPLILRNLHWRRLSLEQLIGLKFSVKYWLDARLIFRRVWKCTLEQVVCTRSWMIVSSFPWNSLSTVTMFTILVPYIPK